MIITVTANPSIDRSLLLRAPLQRGRVQTVLPGPDEAGGKGANVAKALVAAGIPTAALVLADDADPYLALLRATGTPAIVAAAGTPVRVNLTITEPDGTTTKLNAPGAATGEALAGLRDALLRAVDDDTARPTVVVLSGSLPPGAEADWYARLLPELAARGVAVAVDTSGPPLAAVIDAAGAGSRVAVIKPNGDELAEALRSTGVDPAAPDGAALEADPTLAVDAVRRLMAARPGLEAVLLTLGARGAILVAGAPADGGTGSGSGAWLAAAPPTVAVSTVGAGDSALAGWLIAATAGAPHATRLATAVAYGSAAAALAGSTPPTPDQADPGRVHVTVLPTTADPSERL